MGPITTCTHSHLNLAFATKRFNNWPLVRLGILVFLLCPQLVHNKKGLNQIALNDNDHFILP